MSGKVFLGKGIVVSTPHEGFTIHANLSSASGKTTYSSAQTTVIEKPPLARACMHYLACVIKKGFVGAIPRETPAYKEMKAEIQRLYQVEMSMVESCLYPLIGSKQDTIPTNVSLFYQDANGVRYRMLVYIGDKQVF
jgi:hypothetical protein